MEWIEFDGNIPNGWYIVCTKDDEVMEAYWGVYDIEGRTKPSRLPRWTRRNRILRKVVTHYMPLPKPPKRETAQ